MVRRSWIPTIKWFHVKIWLGWKSDKHLPDFPHFLSLSLSLSLSLPLIFCFSFPLSLSITLPHSLLTPSFSFLRSLFSFYSSYSPALQSLTLSYYHPFLSASSFISLLAQLLCLSFSSLTCYWCFILCFSVPPTPIWLFFLLPLADSFLEFFTYHHSLFLTRYFFHLFPLNIWWWGPSSRALDNVEYSLTVITSKSTPTWSGGTCLGQSEKIEDFEKKDKDENLIFFYNLKQLFI